jgi:hypothetical protein
VLWQTFSNQYLPEVRFIRPHGVAGRKCNTITSTSGAESFSRLPRIKLNSRSAGARALGSTAKALQG